MTKHKTDESEAEKESKLRCDICLKNKAEYYRPKDKERLSPLTLWGLATPLRKEGRFDFDKPRQLRMCDSCLPQVMKKDRELELESKLSSDARAAQGKLDNISNASKERNRLLDNLGEDLTEVVPRQRREDEGEEERCLCCQKCGGIISYVTKYTYVMCIDCTAEALVGSEINPVERQKRKEKLDKVFFKELENIRRRMYA